MNVDEPATGHAIQTANRNPHARREGLKSPLGIHATKREPPPSAQRLPGAGCLTSGEQRGRQRQVAIGHRPGSCSENLRTWPARFGQDRGNRHVNFYLGAVDSEQVKGGRFLQAGRQPS